jgi:hypothetical protein
MTLLWTNFVKICSGYAASNGGYDVTWFPDWLDKAQMGDSPSVKKSHVCFCYAWIPGTLSEWSLYQNKDVRMPDDTCPLSGSWVNRLGRHVKPSLRHILIFIELYQRIHLRRSIENCACRWYKARYVSGSRETWMLFWVSWAQLRRNLCHEIRYPVTCKQLQPRQRYEMSGLYLAAQCWWHFLRSRKLCSYSRVSQHL